MDNSKDIKKFRWESNDLLVDEKDFSHRCVQPQCAGCASGTTTQNYRFHYPYLPTSMSAWTDFYYTKKDECGNTISDTSWNCNSRGSEKCLNFGGSHYYSMVPIFKDEYGLGITAWEYQKTHSSRLLIDAT